MPYELVIFIPADHLVTKERYTSSGLQMKQGNLRQCKQVLASTDDVRGNTRSCYVIPTSSIRNSFSFAMDKC